MKRQTIAAQWALGMAELQLPGTAELQSSEVPTTVWHLGYPCAKRTRNRDGLRTGINAWLNRARTQRNGEWRERSVGNASLRASLPRRTSLRSAPPCGLCGSVDQHRTQRGRVPMKSTSTVATEYRIGEKVPGTNWVVRSVLGRGGMGVVLDVEKEASGLRMAMKVVHPALARSGEFTERFLEEVRLLSTLRHPNIVDVTDCDTLADGSPYIMMERLEGRTLRQALSDKDIVFAAENVWNIIGQLCSALHCAHTARPPIVHRDVKPANVFLHDRRHFVSNVKLIDFGVSAVVDEKRAAGTPMGTARYMAPEACRGEGPTPQVDIYALGVIVYEMLTRALPWDLESRSAEAWMNAHLTLEPIPPSRRAPWIPRSVDECLLRALHKDRTQRQRDALEFHEQLGELPFVDDGSGNHRYEGITAPTPETLAHGRAGARERAARRAAVAQSSVPASIDVSIAVESVPNEPSDRALDSEAASVSSDVGVSGGELEASSRSSYEESGDTPLSSASEPPARTRGRRARVAAAFAGVAGLGLGALALGSRWIHGDVGSQPPAAAALPSFLSLADTPPAGRPVEHVPPTNREAAVQGGSARITDSGAGTVVESAKPAGPQESASGGHPVSPTKPAKPKKASSAPAELEPSADSSKTRRPLTDEQLLFIPGAKQ
jgi:eukaryotic-like serine/threonine-protein kinase